MIVGVCVFLAVAVWIVYGQTLHFGFVNYDDNLYVTDNPAVFGGFNRYGIVWAFTHNVSFNWHPLTMLSHMMDCQLYGLAAGGHHLTNVLLHTTSATLLFLGLRKMTGALWRSAFVAAVFALHPLHVESVAWVAERKDVLSGVFFLLTIWAYFYYAGKPSWRRYLSVFVSFTLGLLSKPMLVTLPLVLVLLDYWPLRRFAPAGWRTGWRLVREKIPLLLLAAVFCVITLRSQSGAMVKAQPLSQGLCNALTSYVIYLGQMFWPVNLAVDYPYPKQALPPGEMLAAALLLVAVSAAAWAVRRKYPYLLVGWLWYLGMLVPVIGLVQVGSQPHADRYTYLPQIGLLVMLTWLVADLTVRLRHRLLALACLSAIVLAALIFCARAQTSCWQDSETLWTHTLDCTSNNTVAHNNLGIVLFQKGKLAAAIAQYQQAIGLKPDDVEAHINLAISLLAQGRTDAAIREDQTAVSLQPEDARARHNLGLALEKAGQIDAASNEFQAAVRLNPDDPFSRYNLGNDLLLQGRTDAAISEFQAAIRLKPNYAEACNNLGTAFNGQGKVEVAISQFQAAIRCKPDYPDAHYNLGLTLLNQGQIDAAISQLQETLRLVPSFAGAHNNLGVAFSEKGQMDAAISQFQAAIRLQPDLATARTNLEHALAVKGNGP